MARLRMRVHHVLADARFRRILLGLPGIRHVRLASRSRPSTRQSCLDARNENSDITLPGPHARLRGQPLQRLVHGLGSITAGKNHV